MAKHKHVSRNFPIQCRGRDANGMEILDKPIAVTVSISQAEGDETNISLAVTCPYNTGGHGERCKASHPKIDKIGAGIYCPYAIDIPYALELYNR